MEIQLHEYVGLAVRVQTESDEQFDGSVYAVDPDQNILVLYEPSDLRNRSNFRILKTEIVKSITQLSGDASKAVKLPDNLRPEANLPKLQTAKIKEKADRAAKERSEKLGQDVTIEAQDIFDALSKTLTCSWNGQVIVVWNEIEIKPPYTVDQVAPISGATQSSGSLDRVKKVLNGERDRLSKVQASSKKE